mmetsp:Transcript_130711/g.254738  ORF Transcript_130711/g.254738 Transcript_130711/m.254738 type:complete len:106 (+) Transcript_130711:641-958(+)
MAFALHGAVDSTMPQHSWCSHQVSKPGICHAFLTSKEVETTTLRTVIAITTRSFQMLVRSGKVVQKSKPMPTPLQDVPQKIIQNGCGGGSEHFRVGFQRIWPSWS